MNRLHNSLSTGEFSQFYNRAFECTRLTVIERHKVSTLALSATEPEQVSPTAVRSEASKARDILNLQDTWKNRNDDAATYFERTPPDKAEATSLHENEPEKNISGHGPNQANVRQDEQHVKAQNHRHGLMQKLLEATKGALCFFGPLGDADTFTTSHVILRLYGTLDEIFRVSSGYFTKETW
jgi:hypothetical protein